MGDFYLELQRQKEKAELASLEQCNQKTEKFGLVLQEKDRRELIACRNDSLKKYQRVEFGKGILEEIIFKFADSLYINQNNYLPTMERLQDIFYHYRNEFVEQVSDEMIMERMKQQFEEVCMGDLDYLETCGLQAESGWDRSLLDAALKELIE